MVFGPGASPAAAATPMTPRQDERRSAKRVAAYATRRAVSSMQVLRAGDGAWTLTVLGMAGIIATGSSDNTRSDDPQPSRIVNAGLSWRVTLRRGAGHEVAELLALWVDDLARAVLGCRPFASW